MASLCDDTDVTATATAPLPVPAAPSRSAATRLSIALALCAGVLAIRVWGVTEQFWLLRDQTRDWAIALNDFRDLPLVGPATHVDGYTIGPAFYWILWALRHVFGPWFDDLPHAGGIGQAVLQTVVDGGLLLAIWKRTSSAWVAIAAAVLVMTSSFDLSLAPLVWNPVMGSTLAKLAIALVVSDWYRRSLAWAMATSAVAWMAVHAYTGAIFVAVSVCAVVVLEPLLQRDVKLALQRTGVAMAAIGLLQVPYLLYQWQHHFDAQVMGAVTGSVGTILSGQAAPAFGASWRGYVAAVDFLQLRPVLDHGSGWMLLAAAPIAGWRYRRDPVFVVVLLLPQALAVAGYAFFLGALDHYYYLSLMPPAVLTVVAAVMPPWPSLPASVAKASGPAVCLLVLALVPARARTSQETQRMPEYGPLVRASRTLAHRGQPLRGIITAFPLPPTADAEFPFRILGGQFDPASPWTAIVERDGTIRYSRD